MLLLAVLCVSARTADQALEAAEDEAMAQQPRGLGSRMVDRFAAVNVDGGMLDVSSAVDWAVELRELRLGDDAYEDDMLPYIAVGDDAATLMEAPSENGLAVLRRKQQYSGLEVEVLESQLVVLHGTEKPEERRRREAAGLGPENRLASQLACRPINGSAMFMRARRVQLARSFLWQRLRSPPTLGCWCWPAGLLACWRERAWLRAALRIREERLVRPASPLRPCATVSTVAAELPIPRRLTARLVHRWADRVDGASQGFNPSPGPSLNTHPIPSPAPPHPSPKPKLG